MEAGVRFPRFFHDASSRTPKLPVVEAAGGGRQPADGGTWASRNPRRLHGYMYVAKMIIYIKCQKSLVIVKNVQVNNRTHYMRNRAPAKQLANRKASRRGGDELVS